MNLNKYNFLIYSSHKTATQTLLSILRKNKYKSVHCHILENFKSTLNLNNNVKKKQFIKCLEKYKIKNNTKIKILSCIRNPKDRLISSFFQSFYNDEITFKNINENNTTILKKNKNELCKMYNELIEEEKLPGRMESIDELSNIFNLNILEMLKKKENYYYLDHKLFKLYVLDFNLLINAKNNNNLKYLNNILNLELKKQNSSNLSKNKNYYNKYKKIKNKIGNKLDNIIENQYDNFYFTAF